MALFSLLTSSSETSVESFQEQLPPQVVKNQQDRFKVWATNLGAIQRGRASLDFRLMDSSLMRSTMLKLLKELENTIKRSMMRHDACVPLVVLIIGKNRRASDDWIKTALRRDTGK